MDRVVLEEKEMQELLEAFFKKYPAKALEFFLQPTTLEADDAFSWLKLIYGEEDKNLFLFSQHEVAELIFRLGVFLKPLHARNKRDCWIGSYYCELVEEDNNDGLLTVNIYNDLQYLAEKTRQRIVRCQNTLREVHNRLGEAKKLLIEISYKLK